MIRKLKEHEAKLMKTIIDENNLEIEFNNKRYYLTVTEIPESLVQQNDSGTSLTDQNMEEKKYNILKGSTFSIDDVVDMMDKGVL